MIWIFIQEIKEGLTAEHIDAHRRQIGLLLCFFSRKSEAGCIHSHRLQGITFRLFLELFDITLIIGAHETESLSLGRIHRQSSHGEISTAGAVVLDKFAVIHPIQLVTGKDEVFIHIPLLEQPLIFTNSISCSLKP